jgi:mannose-1-phosphate guanylyltransferase
MSSLELRAMLVTAGFGTRLAPLTDRLPKPAVPVANQPTAWFALDHLRRAGICEFVLNTHHLARELEDALSASAPPDVKLRYVYEPEILGTGGGVHNAWQPRDGETFLVMNGKLVFAPDIALALTLHREHRGFATMIVKEVPDDDPTGVVFVDADGFVRQLPGHAAESIAGLRRCMYTGASLFADRVHRQLPERGCLIRDGYARWLARGERILAHVDASPFRDVGMSLGHYLEANLALATGQMGWPGLTVDAGQVIKADDVTLRPGSSLRQCVLGAAVDIASGVQLERCVVWPNTCVTRSARDAILLPDVAVAVADLAAVRVR